MSDVKRYDLTVSGSMPVVTFSDKGHHVSASDHDRIVAQKDAVIAKLREQRDDAIEFEWMQHEFAGVVKRYDAEIEAIERSEK